MLDRFPAPIGGLLERMVPLLPVDVPVYLVGGAVRDLLRGKAVHDLDLVMPGNVLVAARRLADALGMAYYPLDVERGTARMVLVLPNQVQPEQALPGQTLPGQVLPGQERVVIDIAALRAEDLQADLAARDFTINAMAIDLRHPKQLIDPLGGVQDLHNQQLRLCSPTALQDDPVRVLRAVRQAFGMNLKIAPDMAARIRQAVPQMESVSIERLRDELFRILDTPQAAQAVRMLQLFEALPYVLPELTNLQGITQSPPHVQDVWEHTLDVTGKLHIVLSMFNPNYEPDGAGYLAAGLVAMRLGRYRQQITTHLARAYTPDRSRRSLLALAALYHDIAKPQTSRVDEAGRIRFFEHDALGAEIVHQRSLALRLSGDEADHLKKLVKLHMRPMLLAQGGELPTRRAVYRFFREAGPVGVDICLLSMADFLGTYGAGLPVEVWAHHLDVIRSLMEAWWEKPEQVIAPTRLVSGHKLMQHFNLPSGPQIGELLEAIQEAQASGEVATEEEALALAEEIIGRKVC
jgi:putative nucleotidyltransferase with HDIG domain